MIEIPRLGIEINSFPDPSTQTSPSGILAYGGDLSPSRIMYAYRNGIFPWYSQGDPILWWSPDPRLILKLDDFKLRRSLKKSMKRFEIKMNHNFRAVLKECATIEREGQKGSWLLPEMIEAYCDLYDLGYAISVESYFEGELVGGLYGVMVGKVFCGESMFAKMSDASKSALAYLVAYLQEEGFSFIDCQVPTDHLKSMGAIEVSRDDFLLKLRESM